MFVVKSFLPSVRNAWPIIERELRVGARKRGVYFGRVLAVGVGAAVGLSRLFQSQSVAIGGTAGRFILDGLIAVAFTIACGSCLLTSDAIGSERREGTLPLLFTTQLKSRDVLVGKLAAAGIVSACALLAFLPALMLPLLAGGVTGGEVLRKGLAVIDALALSLAVGLLVSAHEHDRFRAARITCLLTAFVVIIPFCAGDTFVGWFSPLRTAIKAGEVYYKPAPVSYWLSLVLVQGVVWALILGTDRRLQAILRSDVNELDPMSDDAVEVEGQITARRTRPPALGDANPIAWQVRYQPGLTAAVWIAALIVIGYSPTGGFGGGWWGGEPGGLSLLPMALALALAGNALFSWVASRFFVAARRTGEIELLMTTPLSASTIVSGQWQTLRSSLTLVFLGLGVRVVWVGLMVASGSKDFAVNQFVLLGLLPSLHLFVELSALCWLGMWFGLTARNQASAIFCTVALANVVPYLTVVLWSLVEPNLFKWLPSGRATTVVWLAHGLALLWPIGMICWARYRLREALTRVIPADIERDYSFTQFLGEFAQGIRYAARGMPR
jgi:ABC-type transport system involved in multi-copper enzyme maturation permease subunit